MAVYSITTTTSHVTASASNPTTITWGSTATLTFTADSDYNLPSNVSVTGATGTWTQATGTLVLSNPTANITVVVTGTPVPQAYPINFDAMPSPEAASTTISYDVYDGTSTSGTLLGRVPAAITKTYICTTGSVYCKAVESDAIFNSSYSSFSGGLKNESGRDDHASADVDTDYPGIESRHIGLCFDPPMYTVQVKNLGGGYTTVINYTTGQTEVGILPPNMSEPQAFMFYKNTEFGFVTQSAYEYPYKSSSISGGISEITHGTELAVFKITGDGTVDIEFAC